MSNHASSAPRPRRDRWILAVAALFGAVVLALTGAGVYAALNATAFNATAQTVSSGTLSLTLADNGAGFTSTISNMAPGDVVNRYVNLTQGAALDATGLTLGVTDATSTKLTTDATKGLQVTVNSCPAGTWAPTTGVCSTTASTLVTSRSMNGLLTTPAAVAATLAKSAVLTLQIVVTLPDQTETTTNGTLPGSTIQGLSASLTWTFTDTQRTATTTNS
jgi:hypothetical protein